MRILVMGSGVVGVASAWYLARQGHDVTVIDRQSEPAMETSAGNAGQISPGYAAPWAAPGIPLKAMKWMVQKHSPLAIRPDGSLFQLQWMMQMLKNCNIQNYQNNKARMVRLAEYSRDCLKQLRVEIGIDYEGRQGGTLQLFRTQQQFDNAARDIEVLKEAGVPFELIKAQDLHTAEVALKKVSHKLSGGLRLPNDETGDCRIFTKKLAELTKTLGVKYAFGRNVIKLHHSDNEIKVIECEGGEYFHADAFVMAFGSYSRMLLNDLIKIPVYPMKGYSITIPVTNSDAAPVSTILDETYKVAITRFNDRIRVGGMAEISGFDLRLKSARETTLKMVVHDLYPEGGDITKAEFWTGLRPMTPDGTPIVGRTQLKNLYLNTGHGTLGWTMACGSGKLLADIISGNKPEIHSQDLSMERYSKNSPFYQK